MIDWLWAGLSELGHKVTIAEDKVYPQAINLFWENFFPGMGEKIKKMGIVYGIVATEIPDGKSFNGRSDGSWPMRWKGFPEAASGASFIWTMVESTVPFYSQFAPTAFVELGFSELLVPAVRREEPDIDFSFFGLKTPYREKIINELEKKAKVKCPKKFLSAPQVADLISRTKVGLSFKQSESWPIPSPTRLARHLIAKRGLVTEYTEVVTKQAELVSVVPKEGDFVDFALEKLKTWKEDAEKAFERYRVEMPMKSIMENMLSRTGVLSLSPLSSEEEGIKLVLNPPVHVQTIRDVNIIYYNQCFFAIKQSAGEIDFSQGKERLRELYRDDLIVAESLEEVKKLVKLHLKSYFFQIGSKVGLWKG